MEKVTAAQAAGYAAEALLQIRRGTSMQPASDLISMAEQWRELAYLLSDAEHFMSHVELPDDDA